MSKTPLKFVIVPRLIKWLLSSIVVTCRFKYHNRDAYDSLISAGKPFVAVVWHDCSTIAGWAMKNQPVTIMVSDSRDGEYVSRLSNLLGIRTLRGSSSKGGGRAMMSVLRLLRKNKPIAITPDGPRGPRYQLQHGCLWAAALNNVPIIHLHVEATRQWRLRSWDQHQIPKPFSTIHVSFAPEVRVDRSELDANIDEAAQKVRAVMLSNVLATQALAGLPVDQLSEE